MTENKPRWKLVDLPSFRVSGKPGLLVDAEVAKVTEGLFDSAPRNYWIVNDTSEPTARGGHYHPTEGKQECLICLCGRAVVELHSKECCESVVLDRPDLALVIPAEIWHKVLLSVGGVLLSIASRPFDKDESRTEKTCGRHG